MNVEIKDNIEAGENELIKRKNNQTEKNKKIIFYLACLLIFLGLFSYLIYKKIFKKK